MIKFLVKIALVLGVLSLPQCKTHDESSTEKKSPEIQSSAQAKMCLDEGQKDGLPDTYIALCKNDAVQWSARSVFGDQKTSSDTQQLGLAGTPITGELILKNSEIKDLQNMLKGDIEHNQFGKTFTSKFFKAREKNKSGMKMTLPKLKESVSTDNEIPINSFLAEARAETKEGREIQIANFNEQMEDLKHDLQVVEVAKNVIELKLERLKSEKAMGEDYRKAQAYLSSLHSMESFLKSNLQTLGKEVSAIALYDTVRMMKAYRLQAKLAPGTPDHDIVQNAIKEGNSDLLNTLSNEGKAILAKDRVVFFGRKVEDVGYLLQALGYATKPVTIKAKSGPRGTIPVEQELSKLPLQGRAGDVSDFNKYSQESLRKIMDDGLPVSLPKEVMSLRVSENGSDRVFGVIKAGEDGKSWETEWLTQSEINARRATGAEVTLAHDHADPRSMKNSTPQTIKNWNSTKQERGMDFDSWCKKQAPSACGKTEADQHLYAEALNSDYARFLLKKFEGKDNPTLDEINAQAQSAKPITADLDPLALGTPETKSGAFSYRIDTPEKQKFLQENDVFNYYPTAHEYFKVLHARQLGTNQFQLQDQLQHGFENFNTPFPQRLGGDYPIIVVDSKGDGSFKFISATTESGKSIHQNYLDELASMNRETGMEIPLNPVELLDNYKDWKNATFPPYVSEHIDQFIDAFLDGKLALQPKVEKLIQHDLEVFSQEGGVAGKTTMVDWKSATSRAEKKRAFWNYYKKAIPSLRPPLAR